MRTSDRIVHPSRAHLGDAIDGLRRVLGFEPAHAGEFLDSLESECNEHGLDFAVLASHSANECNYFRDDRFQRRRDGFGIGKTGPGVDGAAFDSYEDAAFFAVFEYRVKIGQSPSLDDWSRAAGIYREKVDRLSRIVSRPDWPKVERIDDLNRRFGDDDCVWMCDPNGPEAIVAKGNALFPSLPDQDQQGATMPDMPTIPIIWTPVPTSNRNHPNRKLTHSQKYITWHENGNPNADAVGESNFLLSGGGPSQVSYHFAVDHERAYQMFDLDDLCYHAGDGCNDPVRDVGCFGSVAIEHCQDRDPGRWEATKRNGAILTAMIIAGHPSIRFGDARGDFSADRIAPHQRWSGKNCPEYMLREGAIPSQIARVKAFLAMGDDAPEPEPEPPGVEYPNGMDEGIASWLFGEVKSEGRTYSFNPSGPVSRAWLLYGKARGYSRLIDVRKYGDGREYFRFESMVLWRPNTRSEFAPLGGA